MYVAEDEFQKVRTEKKKTINAAAQACNKLSKALIHINCLYCFSW